MHHFTNRVFIIVVKGGDQILDTTLQPPEWVDINEEHCRRVVRHRGGWVGGSV